MKKLLVLITCTFMLGANASFYLDPSIGINFNGEFGSNDFDNNPITLGVRAGYSTLGFSFGLDVAQSMNVEVENDGSPDGWDFMEYGLFAGYEFPILVRAYAAYVIGGKAERGNAELSDTSGFKLGFGYTGLPFVSINLELKDYEFGKYQDSITTNNNANTDFKTVLLSVSLPVSL